MVTEGIRNISFIYPVFVACFKIEKPSSIWNFLTHLWNELLNILARFIHTIYFKHRTLPAGFLDGSYLWTWILSIKIYFYNCALHHIKFKLVIERISKAITKVNWNFNGNGYMDRLSTSYEIYTHSSIELKSTWSIIKTI